MPDPSSAKLPSEATQLSDYRTVITADLEQGKPIIVGGHAVTVWAIAYQNRIGSEIRRYAPFTSKDLDLFGTQKTLKELHQQLGGKLSWAPPRTPAIGQVILPSGLKVEVLHSIRGLKEVGDQNAVKLHINDMEVRVLDPIATLKAKISNLNSLPQQDRQDLRHVRILIPCVREYLKDVLSEVEKKRLTPREGIHALDEVRHIIQSSETKKVSSQFSLSFEKVWPRVALRGRRQSATLLSVGE